MPDTAATTDFQETQLSAWENVFENWFSLEDYLTDDPWIGIRQSPFLPHMLQYAPPNGCMLESGCGQAQWVYYLCNALRKLSSWITPDEMLFVAFKGECPESH